MPDKKISEFNKLANMKPKNTVNNKSERTVINVLMMAS